MCCYLFKIHILWGLATNLNFLFLSLMPSSKAQHSPIHPHRFHSSFVTINKRSFSSSHFIFHLFSCHHEFIHKYEKEIVEEEKKSNNNKKSKKVFISPTNIFYLFYFYFLLYVLVHTVAIHAVFVPYWFFFQINLN